MSVVLDASALLAMLQREAGGTDVADVLTESFISTVNWTEVVQKSLQNGMNMSGVRTDLEEVGLQIVVFNADDAEVAAHLWQTGSGLSLADRACLALGIKLGAPVLTADRYWTTVETGAEVQVIR
jgi:PIN domain nuclease of toxin-antitoxin system